MGHTGRNWISLGDEAVFKRFGWQLMLGRPRNLIALRPTGLAYKDLKLQFRLTSNCVDR